MSWTALLFTLLFLAGNFFLKTTSSCYQVLQRRRSRQQLRQMEALHFYRSFQNVFFSRAEMEALLFTITATKHFTRFGFAVGLVLWLGSMLQPFGLLEGSLWPLGLDSPIFWAGVLGAVGVLLSLLLGDLLPRLWAARQPERSLRFSAPGSTPFLLAFSPICFGLLAIARLFWKSSEITPIREPVAHVKAKIMEMIEEAGVLNASDLDEKRLLAAVVMLRERIVREVMVPRVELFALPASTTVRAAAKLLTEEGYSRVPVYRDSLDVMVGLLHHKDVLNLYLESEEKGNMTPLDLPVETLCKPLLFTPETSRVSHLLQEFRDRQTHLAVVVDEYGGTEGIVTIEDCLEQIVGDISDEFDEEEEELFTEMSDGSWLIDARMPILEIEDEIGIHLPQEGDYDTLGGYLFHCAGEIPAKGFKVQHSQYDLEVVSSNDRRVERVLISSHRKRKK